MASLEIFLSHNVKPCILFSTLQVLCVYIMTPGLRFYGSPECVTSVSASTCISWAFALVLFIVQLFCHILICLFLLFISFYLLLFLRCLFVFQLGKENVGIQMKGKGKSNLE